MIVSFTTSAAMPRMRANKEALQYFV